MLLLNMCFVASAEAQPSPEIVKQRRDVRRLPGSLNGVNVFNSNSPEVVATEGILLSTFPPEGMKTPAMHLNFPFQGEFDAFLHHINNQSRNDVRKTLYIALVAYSRGPSPALITIDEAGSYLSQPDAPFIPLPAVSPNNDGTVFAGPGDRLTTDYVRNSRALKVKRKVKVQAGQTVVLSVWPVPVVKLTSHNNGRSTLLRMRSARPVHLASVALFSRQGEDGSEIAPTDEEFIRTLVEGGSAGEREKPATPKYVRGPIIYGRVSGVQVGNKWAGTATDDENGNRLTLPDPGGSISFPVSTVAGGTFGTGQVQSAPIVVRNEGSAYEAHGNYGVEYVITLPMYNASQSEKVVALTFESAIKRNDEPGYLHFYKEEPSRRAFFRGTVGFDYKDDRGKRSTSYFHLVQTQGLEGEDLVTLKLKPHELRTATVRLYYPPDATPPQEITLKVKP